LLNMDAQTGKETRAKCVVREKERWKRGGWHMFPNSLKKKRKKQGQGLTKKSGAGRGTGRELGNTWGCQK